jgi:hypothetical protein
MFSLALKGGHKLQVLKTEGTGRMKQVGNLENYITRNYEFNTGHLL